MIFAWWAALEAGDDLKHGAEVKRAFLFWLRPLRCWDIVAVDSGLPLAVPSPQQQRMSGPTLIELTSRSSPPSPPLPRRSGGAGSVLLVTGKLCFLHGCISSTLMRRRAGAGGTLSRQELLTRSLFFFFSFAEAPFLQVPLRAPSPPPSPPPQPPRCHPSLCQRSLMRSQVFPPSLMQQRACGGRQR